MSSAALSYSEPLHLARPETSHPPHLRAVPPLSVADRGYNGEPPDPPSGETAGTAQPAVLSPGLPPLTHRLVGTIAMFACEAVDGTRSIGALAMWITTGAARELEELRSLNIGRRSLYHDYRRIVPSVRRVRVAEPRPSVVEAAVILDTVGRSRAVALRFEGARGRWQATSITVL